MKVCLSAVLRTRAEYEMELADVVDDLLFDARNAYPKETSALMFCKEDIKKICDEGSSAENLALYGELAYYVFEWLEERICDDAILGKLKAESTTTEDLQIRSVCFS